jgi:hypothetical protein
MKTARGLLFPYCINADEPECACRPGRVQSTETLADPKQLSSDFHLNEVLNSALIRATDAVAADAVSY